MNKTTINQLLPREKLITHGPQALSNAELLALFLQTGTKNCSVVAFSCQLLDHFNGLAALLNAPIESLVAIKGLGKAKSTLLKALLALAERYCQEPLQEKPVISDPKQVKQYLQLQLRHKTHECFSVLFLNKAFGLIKYQEIFSGTVDQVTVYKREIAKLALEYNAVHVILAHNHPSGNSTPSEQDIVLTNALKQALTLIEVTVCDHFIVAGNQCQSMAELGCI